MQEDSNNKNAKGFEQQHKKTQTTRNHLFIAEQYARGPEQ